MPFMVIETLTPDAISNLFEVISQSGKIIKLDKVLKLDILIAKLPRGGCANGNQINDWRLDDGSKFLKNIIYI